MAVDYTKTDTYKTYKNTAVSNLKKAKSNDSSSFQKNLYNRIWQGVSSGLGLAQPLNLTPGWAGAAAIVGGVVGAVIGANEKYTENYDLEVKNLNSDIATFTDAARTSQKSRNTLINNVDYYINQTRSSFESSYGKGAFSMLESTIQSILDMDSTTAGQKKISELIGGLSQDTIIGDIETRLLNTDLTDEEGNAVTGRIDYDTLLDLNTKYLDISSLGQSYIQSLYDAVFRSDTEIGDTAEKISTEQAFALAESDQQFASIAESNQEKFAELFLSARNSNISNAESLGETEAASGASGIRASKSSRVSANAKRLKADIANASYAIMLNSYKNNVRASIENGNLSRAKVYFSTQQQIDSLKRQLRTNIGESINNYFHTGTSTALEIGEGERNIDDAMATVAAAEDVLRGESETPNERMKYIYTTSTATK